MGKLHYGSGELVEYSTDIITESNDYQVIHLTLTSETKDLRYRISPDTRASDIQVIKRELDDALEVVTTTDENIEISENLERDYIFITFPSGVRKQYTAQLI